MKKVLLVVLCVCGLVTSLAGVSGAEEKPVWNVLWVIVPDISADVMHYNMPYYDQATGQSGLHDVKVGTFQGVISADEIEQIRELAQQWEDTIESLASVDLVVDLRVFPETVKTVMDPKIAYQNFAYTLENTETTKDWYDPKTHDLVVFSLPREGQAFWDFRGWFTPISDLDTRPLAINTMSLNLTVVLHEAVHALRDFFISQGWSMEQLPICHYEYLYQNEMYYYQKYFQGTLTDPISGLTNTGIKPEMWRVKPTTTLTRKLNVPSVWESNDPTEVREKYATVNEKLHTLAGLLEYDPDYLDWLQKNDGTAYYLLVSERENWDLLLEYDPEYFTDLKRYNSLALTDWHVDSADVRWLLQHDDGYLRWLEVKKPSLAEIMDDIAEADDSLDLILDNDPDYLEWLAGYDLGMLTRLCEKYDLDAQSILTGKTEDVSVDDDTDITPFEPESAQPDEFWENDDNQRELESGSTTQAGGTGGGGGCNAGNIGGFWCVVVIFVIKKYR